MRKGAGRSMVIVRRGNRTLLNNRKQSKNRSLQDVYLAVAYPARCYPAAAGVLVLADRHYGMSRRNAYVRVILDRSVG